MVHKELIMYIIAYNLMRALLLQSCIIMQVLFFRLSSPKKGGFFQNGLREKG
jgi:hypothetical protein